MTRGKWSGKQACPVCGRQISRRGFAWRRHEGTHPELAARRRHADRIFKEAARIAAKEREAAERQ